LLIVFHSAWYSQVVDLVECVCRCGHYWWGRGEDEPLGWCLLGWSLLVAFGRMSWGGLTIAGLAIVLAGKQRGGENWDLRNDTKGDAGCYERGNDLTRREEREAEQRRKFIGGCRPSQQKKKRKNRLSPNNKGNPTRIRFPFKSDPSQGPKFLRFRGFLGFRNRNTRRHHSCIRSHHS
jgi:hypothetical protein